MTFKALGLNEDIIKAVEKIGFVEPTPIQKKAIPEIIAGEADLVGLAQTGTGKTAAFGLPMIHLIDAASPHTQGLVICPTRELCLQISSDFATYSQFVKGLRIAAVYGGASMEKQIRQIRKGVQIIVATPGRLLDLINRKIINISRISYVVLDEADEMLNMGFQEDLDAILDKTPKSKRTWLFSATMPKEVSRIAARYMTEQVEITAGKRNSAAANLTHYNYIVLEKDRYAALKRVIDYYPGIFALVFCRTRVETQQVADKLIRDGYNAEALHGELSQAQRDSAMRRFRGRSLQILVATDIAARGLDVDDISHVINYNLPDEAENYTHRCGRTARAGKSGISIVLTNTRERRKLSEVARRAGVQFTYAKVPDGHAICEKQLYEMVAKMAAVEVRHDDIGSFLQPVYDTLAGLTREELIQKFVSAEFNRFISYYKNTGDINAAVSSKPRSSTSGTKAPSSHRMKTERFFIDVGRLDNIREGAIIRLLCDKSGIRSSRIGKIEIMREFSFFEVERSVAPRILNSLKGARLDGRGVMVQTAEKKTEKKKFKFKNKRKSPQARGARNYTA